jgi:hypothetical protein
LLGLAAGARRLRAAPWVRSARTNPVEFRPIPWPGQRLKRISRWVRFAYSKARARRRRAAVALFCAARITGFEPVRRVHRHGLESRDTVRVLRARHCSSPPCPAGAARVMHRRRNIPCRAHLARQNGRARPRRCAARMMHRRRSASYPLRQSLIPDCPRFLVSLISWLSV